LGVEEVIVGFEAAEPEGLVTAIERFDRGVVRAFAG